MEEVSGSSTLPPTLPLLDKEELASTHCLPVVARGDEAHAEEMLKDSAIGLPLTGMFYYYSTFGRRELGSSGMTLYGFEKFVDDTGLVYEDLLHAAAGSMLFIRAAKASGREEICLPTFARLFLTIALHCYGGSGEEAVEHTQEQAKRCVKNLIQYVHQAGCVQTLPTQYLRTDADCLFHDLTKIQVDEQQDRLCHYLWQKYSIKSHPRAKRRTMDLSHVVKLAKDCQIFPHLCSRLALKRTLLAAVHPGGSRGNLALATTVQDLQLDENAFRYFLFVLSMEVFDTEGTADPKEEQACFDKLLDCIRPYISIKCLQKHSSLSTYSKNSSCNRYANALRQARRSKKDLEQEDIAVPDRHEELESKAEGLEGWLLLATSAQKVKTGAEKEKREVGIEAHDRVLGHHLPREQDSFHRFVSRQESGRSKRARDRCFTELDRVRGIKPEDLSIPNEWSLAKVDGANTGQEGEIYKSGMSVFDSYTVEIETDGDVHISYFKDANVGQSNTKDDDEARLSIALGQNEFLRTSALNDTLVVDLW